MASKNLNVLYVHDFKVAVKKDIIYSAVGLPELYFDRFFEAGFSSVFLLSRSEQYVGQTGYLAYENKNIIPLNVKGGGYLTAFMLLIANIFRFNHISINYPSVLGSVAVILCVVIRKPFVVELAATNDIFRNKINGYYFCRYLDFISKYLLPQAYGVLSVSKSIIPETVPDHKQYIASNVVISTICPPRIQKPLKKVFKVGFCGALTYRKGIDRLIKCAEYSDSLRLPILFQVAGGHADEEFKSELIKSNIQLNGIINGVELDEFYRYIDLFIVLSRSEGLPRAALEAMSYAVPVIGLKLPGLQGILHKSAQFDQNADLSIVVQSIYEICCNQQTYVLLSAHSANIASCYTVKDMADVRRRIYSGLARE